MCEPLQSFYLIILQQHFHAELRINKELLSLFGIANKRNVCILEFSFIIPPKHTRSCSKVEIVS